MTRFIEGLWRMVLAGSVWIVAAGLCRAEEWVTLSVPVQRTITSSDGQSIDVAVLAVSDEGLEVVRKDFRVKQVIPAGRLSADDLAWFRRVRRAAPADTFFVKEVRRHFVGQDPITGNWLPLTAESYSANRYFVVIKVNSLLNLPKPGAPLYGLGERGRNLPVLWLYTTDEVNFSRRGIIGLPPAHAVLSGPKVRTDVEQMKALLSQLRREMQQFNRGAAGPEERQSYAARMRNITPVYWPVTPLHCWWDSPENWGYRRGTQAWLVDREGQPVTYRGVPVQGSPDLVVQVLFARASQLNVSPGPLGR